MGGGVRRSRRALGPWKLKQQTTTKSLGLAQHGPMKIIAIIIPVTILAQVPSLLLVVAPYSKTTFGADDGVINSVFVGRNSGS